MGWGFDDDESESEILEAEGGLAQLRMVQRWVRSPAHQTLTPRMTLSLHQAAMRDILPSAGRWRTSDDVEIFGSSHVPPPHEDLPRLTQEACNYVNGSNDALFAAAFIMWRLAWIHPFDDGNGRTARAVSYLVMSQRLGRELPGERPVPQRMKYAPRAYYRALEAADRAWSSGVVDVSDLQRLIEFYLVAQLRNDPPELPDW
jgi:Fic family protein